MESCGNLDKCCPTCKRVSSVTARTYIFVSSMRSPAMYFYIDTLLSLEVNRWYVYVSIGAWEVSVGQIRQSLT